MAKLIGLTLGTEGTESSGRKENAGSIYNVCTRIDPNCRANSWSLPKADANNKRTISCLYRALWYNYVT